MTDRDVERIEIPGVETAGPNKITDAHARRAEDVLANEERLLAALEAANVATWDWNLLTGDVIWTENLERVHGLPDGTFDGSFDRYISIVHPGDRDRLTRSFQAAIAGTSEYSEEYRALRPDGSVQWIATRGRVTRDASGKPVRIVGICMDCSAQKRIEQALIRREQEFVALVENAPDVISRHDSELRFLYVNPVIERHTGMRREDIIGQTNAEIGLPPNPETREDIENAIKHVFKTGTEVSIPFTSERDGRIKVYHARFVPELGTSRRVESVLSIARDITDLVQAQEAMSDTAHLLTTTLRSIGDAVIVTDATGSVTFLNPVAEQLTGFTFDEAAGKPSESIFRIVNEETRERVESPVERVIRDGVVVGLANHTILISRDGGEHPIDDSGAPIRDDNGELLGVVLVFRDVTEQRGVQDQIKQSEKRYHVLSDTIPQIIWECDAVGVCTYFNAYLERYAGLTVAQCLGEGWTALIHPDDVEPLREAWHEARRDRRDMELEVRVRVTDGSYKWNLLRGLPQSNGDDITHWIGTATDIDERRQAAITQRFLADAGALLVSSLEYEITLQNVARLAVPHLADWCVVHVAEESGQARRVAVAHADPEKIAWVMDLEERYPPDNDPSRGVPRVLATGEPLFIPVIADELLVEAAKDEYHLDALRRLEFTSAIAVPMVARDRIVGAISFVSAEARRRFTGADLAAAQDLARMAALAADNARLYTAAREEIAERARAEFEVQALNARLRRAMAETHHRVKNNLQVISAMVDLQTYDHLETVPLNAIRRIGDHARALAMLHDLLTQEAKRSGDTDSISAGEALERLIPLVQSTLGDRRVRHDVVDLRLPVREGASLALLVNELLSNGAKHGRGEIHLTLEVYDETVQLEVCDDGPGFAEDFDAESEGSTGMELINSVVRWDLRGEVRYENRESGGARVVVTFPVPQLESRTAQPDEPLAPEQPAQLAMPGEPQVR